MLLRCYFWFSNGAVEPHPMSRPLAFPTATRLIDRQIDRQPNNQDKTCLSAAGFVESVTQLRGEVSPT
jgi:hypothetical protein